MPGPTTKGTYIGRSAGETIGVVHQRRAETLAADHPACRVCGQPMVCGQARSNEGAHFACDPGRAAFDQIAAGRKPDEKCYACWASIITTGEADHSEHEAAA